MLTVYIDFKSADAYLAMAPTLALARRTSIDLDWKPFRVIEREVPPLRSRETIGESHRRVRAQSQRDLAIKYAAHQGIDLRFPPATGSTDLALAVLGAIEVDPLPFILAAFEAYWVSHADLDDPRIVSRLMTDSQTQLSCDLDAARGRFDLAQAEAEETGIVGVPAYLIQEQIFVGRQHLPWIEDLVCNT
ncbi:MAG: DsbA family protein [Pseudomonadota bacterium]